MQDNTAISRKLNASSRLLKQLRERPSDDALLMEILELVDEARDAVQALDD